MQLSTSLTREEEEKVLTPHEYLRDKRLLTNFYFAGQNPGYSYTHIIENLSKCAKFIDYIDTRLIANVKLRDYYNKPVDLKVFLDRLTNY